MLNVDAHHQPNGTANFSRRTKYQIHNQTHKQWNNVRWWPDLYLLCAVEKIISTTMISNYLCPSHYNNHFILRALCIRKAPNTARFCSLFRILFIFQPVHSTNYESMQQRCWCLFCIFISFRCVVCCMFYSLRMHEIFQFITHFLLFFLSSSSFFISCLLSSRAHFCCCCCCWKKHAHQLQPIADEWRCGFTWLPFSLSFVNENKNSMRYLIWQNRILSFFSINFDFFFTSTFAPCHFLHAFFILSRDLFDRCLSNNTIFKGSKFVPFHYYHLFYIFVFFVFSLFLSVFHSTGWDCWALVILLVERTWKNLIANFWLSI